MHRAFLDAGNHKKIVSMYSGILSPSEVGKINLEAQSHTRMMYVLGIEHYNFATKIAKMQWRQRISRLYYASYNVSKAVRFDSDGVYSTEVKDHTKVGELPSSFPDRATYTNELRNLREDRNASDYDHLAVKSDLLRTPEAYQTTVLNFIRHAHDYLSSRGNVLGAKP
ncbi:hypothetical protein [Asticcacaulis sp.]|uniref:hypothetical protein n=1 Tax=Asticcacaulis sp. TaxID=1872648 RepID=UPI00260AB7AE|nr:hypothetical protein [Asticcacaulis sp.]